MRHLSYDASKKLVTKTIIILGIITLTEVIFALLAKGHLIEGIRFPLLILGFVMISMSLVKAYMIVYEFMHMKYEVPGLVKTVLLPTLLLVWAIIAFFAEGNYWNHKRAGQENMNQEQVESPVKMGMNIRHLEESDFN